MKALFLTFLTFLLLYLYNLTIAQADPITLDYSSLTGCIEFPPKYPGGCKDMKKLFADNMRFPKEPKEAKKQKITVRVVITYMVDTFGNTTNVVVVESAGKHFDEEAVRLVGMLKGWKPATLNGKKVIYYQSQPFLFVPYVSKLRRIDKCKSKRWRK